MVSKLNNIKTEGSLGSNVAKIYADIGFAGLWRGLGTRIFMIGTLTGTIYYTLKKDFNGGFTTLSRQPLGSRPPEAHHMLLLLESIDLYITK